MSDPTSPGGADASRKTVRPIAPIKVTVPSADKLVCERCGNAEMYRMHAVWRCPNCGFKTDCCGW